MLECCAFTLNISELSDECCLACVMLWHWTEYQTWVTTVAQFRFRPDTRRLCKALCFKRVENLQAQCHRVRTATSSWGRETRSKAMVHHRYTVGSAAHRAYNLWTPWGVNVGGSPLHHYQSAFIWPSFQLAAFKCLNRAPARNVILHVFLYDTWNACYVIHRPWVDLIHCCLHACQLTGKEGKGGVDLLNCQSEIWDGEMHSLCQQDTLGAHRTRLWETSHALQVMFCFMLSAKTRCKMVCSAIFHALFSLSSVLYFGPYQHTRHNNFLALQPLCD